MSDKPQVWDDEEYPWINAEVNSASKVGMARRVRDGVDVAAPTDATARGVDYAPPYADTE